MRDKRRGSAPSPPRQPPKQMQYFRVYSYGQVRTEIQWGQRKIHPEKKTAENQHFQQFFILFRSPSPLTAERLKVFVKVSPKSLKSFKEKASQTGGAFPYSSTPFFLSSSLALSMESIPVGFLVSPMSYIPFGSSEPRRVPIPPASRSAAVFPSFIVFTPIS